MEPQKKIWCDKDEHNRFERYHDFNTWLESDDESANGVRGDNGISNIRHPSKAFFTGNMEAYDQVLEVYRRDRRHAVLNESYFQEQTEDNHWFERNLSHFDQLVEKLAGNEVVPFIGAGISVNGGYPSWKEHLRQQGRTAGMQLEDIEDLLSTGEYEEIIEKIERQRGRDVFAEEIRDVFVKPGEITRSLVLLTSLFNNTIITTNYDCLIESAYKKFTDMKPQIINGPRLEGVAASDKMTIYKLHGDVKNPSECILSKNQYDAAYGKDSIAITNRIPKLLEYFYKNSSLLFMGCGLNNDRTIRVFREIKKKCIGLEIPQHFAIEQAPETEEEFVQRNAYLRSLGITGIWFEKGRFEYVEAILELALNELRYRGVDDIEGKHQQVNNISKGFNVLFGSLCARIRKLIRPSKAF